MPGKHKNRDEYNRLFERIERNFNPEELTRTNQEKFIHVYSIGTQGLADMIEMTGVVHRQIENAKSIPQLLGIANNLKDVVVHQTTLTNFYNDKLAELQIEAEERKIAEYIAIGTQYGLTRGITFNEKTTVKVYNRWGRSRKKAVVIRQANRFKAWKYVV